MLFSVAVHNKLLLDEMHMWHAHNILIQTIYIQITNFTYDFLMFSFGSILCQNVCSHRLDLHKLWRLSFSNIKAICFIQFSVDFNANRFISWFLCVLTLCYILHLHLMHSISLSMTFITFYHLI